jgi:uncharacterized protein YodC (DUF2158 family)
MDELEAALHAQIAVGDVVHLRSGGPWMTVQEVSGGVAACGWFTRKQELLVYDFPCLGLVKIR